jgi:hypothetical protein
MQESGARIQESKVGMPGRSDKNDLRVLCVENQSFPNTATIPCRIRRCFCFILNSDSCLLSPEQYI